MIRRTILAVFLVIATIITTTIFKPQPTYAQTCGLDNEIVDPINFDWTYVDDASDPHYVGTLEYGEANFNINGYTLTTRAYRQEGGSYSIPGPTIRMEPGNKYVLRFKNLLPYETPSAAHNEYKDPNITNIHTHGLHISGEGPSDDVTRMFEGGFGGDYVYEIPDDHMGGTYWYHAHHHGSTFLQVSTGGFGLILIDDSGDGIPASVAAMEEHQVLIGYLDTGAAGTGGDTLVSGTLPAGWTVNGQVNGNLCVSPNTWTHFRILLADRDAKPKDVIIGQGCEAKLLARDGVWRTVAPKDLPTRTVNLTGASRADLAVRCISDTEILVGTQTVANIIVSGSADTGPHPYAQDGVSTWEADRPEYLRDLRSATNVHSERINMGARTVNGSKFDHATPTLRLDANAVQNWEIRGAGNHPFHLHVYHFQAQAGCGGDFEEGEYYDTLAASCSVRFDLNAATSTVYAGRTIMHCHILEHEDQGAMGWLDVVGGIAPPTYPDPAKFGYSGKYSLSAVTKPAAPSNLKALNPTTNSIDLSWTDNASNESGFRIFRSENGTSFSERASVGANVTTFKDTGLTAETQYWYKLLAYNAGGDSSFSNTETIITLPVGQATSVTVGSITVTTVNGGQGMKSGQATVIVVDEFGQPVQGALVTGNFSGTFTEDVTGAATNSSGATVITTSRAAKGQVSVTFCVTSITHPTLTGWTGKVCGSN